MSGRCTLVVFCRRPGKGAGKQRLAAGVGQDAALAIAEALLACALEDAAQWPGEVVLAPSSPEDLPWARSLLQRSVHVVPQQGTGLGARLNYVDWQLRAAGHERLLFIGSDAPALDASRLTSACSSLASADVVLLPAADGGVVLMGSRRGWPELADLPWSTAELGQALADRCRAASLLVECHAESFDVDELADLARAQRELRDDTRPARRALLALIGTRSELQVPRVAVSVVIATHRDDEPLRRLLRQLATLRPAPAELIVVDGARSEQTAILCREYGARHEPGVACRGVQLASGARAARGDVLWFLHADAQVREDSIAVIQHAVAQGAAGGYFRFRFGGARPWIARQLEKWIAWRCRLALVYGDQGLFATRQAYFASAGFAPEPLFEEAPLVHALRRTGAFVALPVDIVVDARKWERDGYLRRTLRNRLLALAYWVGIAPRRLAGKV